MPPTRRPAVRARSGRRGSPELRLRIGFVVIAMVLSVFGARLISLQGIDAKSYAAEAMAQGLVTVVLPAERGDVLDRNGQPLAQSVDGLMIVANPAQTSDYAAPLASFLAKRVHVDYFTTLKRLRKSDTQFQYLARQVPAALATRVVEQADAKGYEGLATRRDPVRDYPARDVLANLVGFLGTPDAKKNDRARPLAGFERTFNRQLAGHDGKASYQVGQGIRIPLADSTLEKPVDGTDLHTTLDLDLSFYAARLLRQTVEDTHSLSGVIVVMDSRTGQVLALSDYPTYDAADPTDAAKADLGSRALSDVYEPGSVEKVLTVSALLDAGQVTPQTRFVVPSELPRNDGVIHDWFSHGTLQLTMTGVLAKSSNIGTVLAADKLGKRQMLGYLRGFGLGQPTGAGVPGESGGLLPAGAAMTPQIKDRMAFGQSLSVNALQMTAAVNTVANHGLYVSPSLIQGSATTRWGAEVGTDQAVERQVVSPAAASQTARMMERVLDPEDGVAPAAAVAGYRVAGKTGTAQRVGAECGCYDGTTVSFAGFAPADQPRFTVYVALHKPGVEGGGGSLAGPVFSRVMAFALHRYGIKPTGTPPSHLPVSWTR